MNKKNLTTVNLVGAGWVFSHMRNREHRSHYVNKKKTPISRDTFEVVNSTKKKIRPITAIHN